jgi:hypothetical protein
LRKWIPTSRPYDRGKDWLTNAEGHQPPHAFDVIVARRNPRDNFRVLVAGEFPKDQPPWKTQTQIEVPRTPEGILKCVGPLLRFSNELILVDQNFDAAEARFREPFAALLGAGVTRAWQRCELHAGHPLTKQGRPDKEVLGSRIHHMQHYLPSLIPVGVTVRIRFWYRKGGGKKLHPRFVLTDYGGIQFDYGLDEGDGPDDTTIASLIDHDLWQAVRRDFGLEDGWGPVFDSDADCVCDIRGALSPQGSR